MRQICTYNSFPMIIYQKCPCCVHGGARLKHSPLFILQDNSTLITSGVLLKSTLSSLGNLTNTRPFHVKMCQMGNWFFSNLFHGALDIWATLVKTQEQIQYV